MTDVALSARIERLERVARRDRTFALGALALALATAQVPAPRAQPPLIVRDTAGNTATLSANGLQVRDRTNTLRSGAGIDPDGSPAVDFYDAAGALRQSMSLLAGRPVLRQFDRAGQRRAELFLATDTENGEFTLRDAAGATRLAAYRGAQGLPELAVYGSDGKVRSYLSTDDDGPYLVMKDAAGISRLNAGQYTSGTLGLDVRDVAGNAVWAKP